MCALGHYFEGAGLATVEIVLIREHAERIRPPRALWVPFELGRPLGPPDDAPFQRRVVATALHQLVAVDRPGTIADFPEDEPRRWADSAWIAPTGIEPDRLRDSPRSILVNNFLEEVARLAPYHERARAKRGRTTVGLVGRPIRVLADYVASFLSGQIRGSLGSNMSAALALRFASDDLKAYYLEAALAMDGRPSSRQLLDWFWDSTWAGAALLAARALALASPDTKLRRIGEHFLVPRTRVPRDEPADD